MNEEPYPYELNDRGHRWKRDKYGSIDIFATEYGDHHNGPMCIVCYYGFCHHCQKEATKDCEVIIEGEVLNGRLLK